MSQSSLCYICAIKQPFFQTNQRKSETNASSDENLCDIRNFWKWKQGRILTSTNFSSFPHTVYTLSPPQVFPFAFYFIPHSFDLMPSYCYFFHSTGIPQFPFSFSLLPASHSLLIHLLSFALFSSLVLSFHHFFFFFFLSTLSFFSPSQWADTT